MTGTLDYPYIRASTECPLCGTAKARGLIACWPCFREIKLQVNNAEGFLVLAEAQHKRVQQGLLAYAAQLKLERELKL